MNKLYIYIDETYQLHKAPQFYAFGGFLTNDIEKMRSEYKKLLRKCDAIKEEVKSNDKKSEKIREKIIKDGYLNENLKYFAISQKRDQNMNYEYFEDNIYKQEIVFYESLLKILLSEVIKKYGNEIDISINVEVDKIDKIKKDFYKELKDELKEEYNLQWIDIEIRDSKLSFGLQLADQITGIYREYIKENRYEEFIRSFIINIEEPLSYN